MNQPSSQTDLSDQPPSLSSAYPSFTERLRIEKADMPQIKDMPATDFLYRRRLKQTPISLIKRIERYFSGLLKVGRIYGTLKDTSQELGIVGAQVEGIAGDLSSLHHELQRVEHQVALVEARIDDMEVEEMQNMQATPSEPASDSYLKLTATIDELRAEIDQAGGMLRDQAERADNLADTIDKSKAGFRREIDHVRTELSETAGGLRQQYAVSASEQAGQSRAYSSLSRRLDRLQFGDDMALSTAVPPAGLDALIETFYARLEDRYRGSREEIAKRLVKYLPDAETATARTNKQVLDLGCGRGEWLETLRQRGIGAVGVDFNDMQLHEAQALGLTVYHSDANRFLADAEDASYGMVTAHHLAEHLPFETLVWMTREAMRVLAPGGVLLYETPNVRNIVVGASTFHIDPTHKRPLPAEVLETIFDTVGFHPVETRFLHAHPKYDEVVRTNRLDSEIAGLLFGPQDLAVLGTKPDGLS